MGKSHDVVQHFQQPQDQVGLRLAARLLPFSDHSLSEVVELRGEPEVLVALCRHGRLQARPFGVGVRVHGESRFGVSGRRGVFQGIRIGSFVHALEFVFRY